MRSTTVEAPAGLVLLDKQPGLTSFQALFPTKRLYGSSVGHTGTLDRFAEGLLVVLVGKLTKLNPLFTAFDKVYEADFTFGYETETLDPEGSVVFRGSAPEDSLLGLATGFVGTLEQVPPNYSAVHVAGKRASDRVRDGESLDLAARRITVYSLDVLAWNNPVLTVRIHCSKGTYVRSMARDWGRASGCGATVTRLRRLAVGPFRLPELSPLWIPAQEVFEQLAIPSHRVEAGAVPAILNGRDAGQFVPSLAQEVATLVALKDEKGTLLAMVEASQGSWVYRFVDRGPST